MADNFPLPTNAVTTKNAATDEVTYSGDTADVQLVRPVLTTGSEGSKTVVGLTGDASNGLDVDVTRLPSCPADVLAIDGDAGYTAADLAKNLTQTDDGRLRTSIAALVSDTVQSYLDGELKTLSLAGDGRLRVITASESYNFTAWGDPEGFEAIAGNIDCAYSAW
jgi:hypothetical protein